MAKKIVEFRGVTDLVIAKITEDSADTLTYGAVMEVAGVSELTKERETESETHYYDNQPAIVINSDGSDTITATVSVIPLDVLAEITGQFYDDTKKVLVETGGTKPYFALGYKTKATDGTERYVWRYKGTFAVPSSTHTTENDGTDAEGQELVYTGVKTTHKFTACGTNGIPASAYSMVVEKDALADPTTFFDKVVTPDDTY